MHFSRSQMARALGCSYSSILQWEHINQKHFKTESRELISDFVYNLVEDNYVAIKLPF
ncbi:MAG: hypothetical protein LBE27_06065 [Deltaproteobacteria bacterium]|jgi:transcriptional regulator with XRE-family HTH domain|nr:hypothetical protein [Deltaproteobacteria bacterium]